MTASKPTIGCSAAGRLPPPSAWTLTSAASIAPSAFMSPLREAAKKASASSRPRCFSTWKARSRLADMGARAGSELAAGGGIAADGRGDFLEFQPEHVVQQEGRPLERRKTFQRQHQRQGDVLLVLLFDDGIGKPRADIGLALAPRRFELIETEARDRAAQERLGFAHLAAVGPHPADEGLLHDILGVSHGAEHAVSDAHELRTQRVELAAASSWPGARHQAAALPLAAADFAMPPDRQTGRSRPRCGSSR